MTGHEVLDLTSGFRVVKANLFKRFLYLLPNGFSYPTTITMAFFRSGYSVAYEPIEVDKRIGKSHIRLWRDGVRFLLIIFKIGTLFSPLKLFLPISLAFFTDRAWVLRLYLPDDRPLYQHVGAAVHHLGADFPDRPGVRADHCADVSRPGRLMPGRLRTSSRR